MTAPTTSSLRRVIASGLLLVMGLMWGLQFAMLKLAAQGGHSDLTVLMVALILLSVIFSLIVLLRKERFWPGWHVLVFFTVIGLIGYVIPLLAALYAASQLSAGVLVLIASMSPVVAIGTALILRTESVSPSRIAAVGVGILSVALVLLPQFDLPNSGKALWMLVALLVPFAYGVESVYIARFWPRGLTALQAVTGETIVAALLVAQIFLLSGERLPTTLEGGAGEVAILVFVAAGVIESLIYFYLIRRTGGVFVSFGTFISLFAGIGWGIILFDETHNSLTWFAVVMLVAALVLAGKEPPAPDRPKPG